MLIKWSLCFYKDNLQFTLDVINFDIKFVDLQANDIMT